MQRNHLRLIEQDSKHAQWREEQTENTHTHTHTCTSKGMTDQMVSHDQWWLHSCMAEKCWWCWNDIAVNGRVISQIATGDIASCFWRLWLCWCILLGKHFPSNITWHSLPFIDFIFFHEETALWLQRLYLVQDDFSRVKGIDDWRPKVSLIGLMHYPCHYAAHDHTLNVR